MGGAKKSTWIGGTVFAAVAIAAAFWFLLISPSLSSASDTRGQADQVKQQNDMLTMKITKLAADSKKLPDFKNQLAQIQTQIPTTPSLAAFIRQIDTIAVAHGVTVVSVAPAPPAAVTLATAAAAQPVAPSDPTSTSPTDGASASPSPAPSAAAPAPGAAAPAAGAGGSVPSGFTSVSYAIDVIGTYDNALAFLSDLQNAGPRVFLVSALTGTGLQDAPAGSGKPATKVGDVELQITGFTYSLPDALAAATPAPAPTATPAPLPGAVPGKDPLVPVKGK